MWGGGGSGWKKCFPLPAGKDQSNSLNSARFFYISGGPGDHPPFLETHGNSGRLGRSAYTFKERNNFNSLEKKNIYQKFGGGAMAPVAPLATPLSLMQTCRHPCIASISGLLISKVGLQTN